MGRRGAMLVAVQIMMMGCPPAEDTEAPVVDADGDGFSEADDCDDANGLVNPDAEEVCDGVDNDCDFDVDDSSATDAIAWYFDLDGDGFAGPVLAAMACTAPEGTGDTVLDCDDFVAATNPSGTETCDGADNDCDDEVDEDPIDAAEYYADGDDDGFGDPEVSESACAAPTGFVSDASDCDDTDATLNPETLWYADLDGDGVSGEVAFWVGCEGPEGYALEALDCDDLDEAVYPDAIEVCDGQRNDCTEGDADEDAVDAFPSFADADGDLYGDSEDETTGCAIGAGAVLNDADCDDTNSEIHPGAPERAADVVDQNCDGHELCYVDSDKDTFRGGNSVVDSSDLNCVTPGEAWETDVDCEDSIADIFPGATDDCDGFDSDCDGIVDDEGLVTYYADLDGDGYSGSLLSISTCLAPLGYAATVTDCDDADRNSYPGATELCDGNDDNCDGDVDEGYADVDADGVADCDLLCPAYVSAGVGEGGIGSLDDPYGSINEAIENRPPDCHEIVLLRGTYAEEVDFGGEDLVLRSYSGPEVTVLKPTAPSKSILQFTNGETSAARVEGLTLTGADVGNGGAIYIWGASPTIVGNIIENNRAQNGAGIWAKASNAAILENTIRNNVATLNGGGAYLESHDGLFQGNTVWGNEAYDANSAFTFGGGLYLYESDTRVQQNTFQASSAGWDGSAMMIAFGSPILAYNLFEDNDIVGGCATFRAWGSGATVVGNLMVADSTSWANACFTGANTAMFAHNTVVGGHNGLAFFYEGNAMTVVNNIFTDWDAYGLANGDGVDDPSGYTFAGNVVQSDLSNSPYYWSGDVDWDLDGTDGNTSGDPLLWEDGTLRPGSAAINAGVDPADYGVDLAALGLDRDSDAVARGQFGAYDAGAFEVDSLPSSCLDALLNVDFEADNGLYWIEPVDAALQTFCDMWTDGGGWTLVQRTVWEWDETQTLKTDYATWYGTTLGSPEMGEAFRIAGSQWPGLNVDLEHMFVHRLRQEDGNACDPLYYTATNGTLTVSSTGTTISGTVQPVMLFNEETFDASDVGNGTSCVTDGDAVPWFYQACCWTCPSYGGIYWSDEPHPMVDSYTNYTTGELYGNTQADVCSGAVKLASNASYYRGVDAMEYYMR